MGADRRPVHHPDGGVVCSPRSGLAIEARGLCKAFGRTAVLRGLDLDVAWGEVVAIVGPNGCGKSTLIKTLATLTKSDSGEVRVAGVEVGRDAGAARRLTGTLTHETLLYDELTGYENLRFHGRLFGVAGLDRRIRDVADEMGVSGALHRRVGTLSHGTAKRLSIARAVLHDPAVLLLDEPDSGLDQQALSLLESLLERGRGRGRAVVMATHNLERAAATADRTGVLSDGLIATMEPAVSSSEARTQQAMKGGAGARP